MSTSDRNLKIRWNEAFAPGFGVQGEGAKQTSIGEKSGFRGIKQDVHCPREQVEYRHQEMKGFQGKADGVSE